MFILLVVPKILNKLVVTIYYLNNQFTNNLTVLVFYGVNYIDYGYTYLQLDDRHRNGLNF